MTAAGCLAAGVAALEATWRGLIIVHCGACRRAVAHHAVISARRAASSFVGMCAETVPGARAPAARRSAGGEVGHGALGDPKPRYPRISGPRESVTLDR